MCHLSLSKDNGVRSESALIVAAMLWTSPGLMPEQKGGQKLTAWWFLRSVNDNKFG